jgi:protein TonB
MNTRALHAPGDRVAGLLWTAAAVVVVAAHLGLIAAAMRWYRHEEPAGSATPAIMVDMAPVSAAPDVQPQDDAPGPAMQQADAPAQPPPEPMRQSIVEDQIAPTSPVETPAVEAPPEQKQELAAAPQPEPVQLPPPDPPEPAVEDRKPDLSEVREKPSDAPPAPLSTAPAPAARQGETASPVAGASATAMVRYNQMIAARLQRFRRYPVAARAAHQQGVARVLFTLDRTGHLISSRLTQSTGFAALDAETLAVLQRAQPFPPFPSGKPGASASFDVPITFDLQ